MTTARDVIAPQLIEQIARAMTRAYGYDPDGEGGDQISGIYNNWECRKGQATAFVTDLLSATEPVRQELAALLYPCRRKCEWRLNGNVSCGCACKCCQLPLPALPSEDSKS